MKKILTAAMIAVLLAGMPACGGKKKKEAPTPAPLPPAWKLGTCPAARIEIEPRRTDQAGCDIGSNCAVSLAATAYDQTGKPVAAPLTWSLRYPDADDPRVSGGHRLEPAAGSQAVFQAAGRVPGLFSILAQDRTCNQGTADQPQYVTGEAWIVVHNPPAAPLHCGRMRVTYGDKIDRMGDKVLASSKVLLIAELSGPQKLPRGNKVRFYINGKPFSFKRPLYRDLEVPLSPGMTTGYKALLPIYLAPGDYQVRYELMEKGQAECGSRTERFKAK